MRRDNALTVRVLAIPGTPSSRTWPRHSKAMSHLLLSSSCPTTTLLISSRMCCVSSGTAFINLAPSERLGTALSDSQTHRGPVQDPTQRGHADKDRSSPIRSAAEL